MAIMGAMRRLAIVLALGVVGCSHVAQMTAADLAGRAQRNMIEAQQNLAGRPVIVLGACGGGPAKLIMEAGCGLVWADGREREVLTWLRNAPDSSRTIRETFEVCFSHHHALRRWRTALALSQTDAAPPALIALADAA